MIFDVDAGQITRLDSLQLVQLMKQLLLAECRSTEIPLRAVGAPVQISVADGGEDGRVDWIGAAEGTDYFPTRFSIFQAKAQNLTEASIRAEVLRASKKGRPTLNEAIKEVLARKGAYIVFCSHAFGGQKIKKLKKAVEVAIRAGQGKLADIAAIEIYDANRITDWVNRHPSVALWLTELHRRRAVAGFQSWHSWGRNPEIAKVPWVAATPPRFVPINHLIPEAERTERGRNAWTSAQAAEGIADHLSEDGRIVRIVGPSGFGKSRFAFELFNHPVTATAEINASAVVYANLAIAENEVAKLALEIADAAASTILVVDECPDDMHLTLAKIAGRAGSRMRLVTIDVETKVGSQASHTLAIRLEPAGVELIKAIARGIAPALDEPASRLIGDLAQGFPEMAVLAAQLDARRRPTIDSAEQILDRIIWGKRPQNAEAQKALEVLSLFEWVGLSGSVADEGVYIAKSLAGVSEDTFVEHIKSFRSRGVVTERGDFAQVTPIPLAARLGIHRISLIARPKLMEFFANAPARLRGSLLRRMRWLDVSPEARTFARKLLSPDCLGNLTTLNTDFGADCLDRLVHVDPDSAMATIQRVFGSLSYEELLGVNGGRRHLVWALEKLAFRKESFDSAASLLRRLAAAEVENRIGNNATGQFTQLFQLHLSGTQAPPAQRLLVLDDGLQSANSRERQVCVEALDRMLDTGHFSRMGSAEEIGSQDELEDWAPMTYGEIWEFYRQATRRLTDIAVADDPLARRAMEILGLHIRSLLSHLPLDDIKSMIALIVRQHGFWAEAVQKVNEWLYFDRTDAPREIGDVIRAYFDELMPVDPVELVVLYSRGWQTDFHDPDTNYDREEPLGIDIDYAARKAAELATIIIRDPVMTDSVCDRLVVSDAKSSYAVGRRLAELAPDPVQLFRTALIKAEASDAAPCVQFFSGMVAGADARDPTAARDCVRAALCSPKMRKDAIVMIGAGKLQAGDLDLVISLLHSHDVEPRQCAVLSFGRGLDHLPPDAVLPLLEELTRHGAAGLWTVLEIITMIAYGTKELPASVVPLLRNVLVSPELFDGLVHPTMDGHHLEVIVEALSKRGLIDKNFAAALARQLLSICERGSDSLFRALHSSVRKALKVIIEGRPREVWSSVARLLLRRDWRLRHRLERLIESDHDDHLGPGLLALFPPELYLKWVRKDPGGRAAIVMHWLPIATKAADGSLRWTPALEAFVEEFGAEDMVLTSLSSRLHPRSWWGSLVPHLEPQQRLLESWSNHPRSEVRRWVRDQINWIKQEIEVETKRNEEAAVRYS
jgi:hypothetical protein